MRIVIAGFHLESASFLSQTSSKMDFEANTVRGEKLVTEYEHTNTVIGGFIEQCRAEDAGLLPLLYSYLGALGPAENDAVVAYANEIANSAAAVSPDGILLHLHGATWAPGFEDTEKYFLDTLRAKLGPEVPIVVCFDYHGNIAQTTVQAVDAVFAYHKSPHTDMGETGRRAANCLFAILKDGFIPSVVVRKPGVMVPSIFSATSLQPLASIIEQARAMEKAAANYLDISIMAGFSYADDCNAGFSVVVVSGEDEGTTEKMADLLSQKIKEFRQDLYRPIQVYSIGDAVDYSLKKANLSSKPIVLLEHADRMNDSTYLLSELVGKNAQRAAIPFLWDNEAAQLAHSAGVGAKISIHLGGWSSPKAGPRNKYECEVLRTGPVSYRISGEMLKGQNVDLGMTALLRIGGVTVSVVSNFAFTVDEDVFTVFEQNIADYDIIVLRSKTHFRQYYEQAASEILIVDTPDHGPADLTLIPYKNVNLAETYPFNARDKLKVPTP